jgi:hypothetical protein
MKQTELVEKLQRLESTDDHAERHNLALELADTRDPRVFDVLVKLIQRPELENRRGTLVYCLENYDCSSIVEFLERLVATGNFEVASQAEMILDEQELRLV